MGGGGWTLPADGAVGIPVPPSEHLPWVQRLRRSFLPRSGAPTLLLCAGAVSAQAPVPHPVRNRGIPPEGPWSKPKKDGSQSLYLDYLLSYLESPVSPSACPAHFLPSSYTYELSARPGAPHAG